MNKSNMKIACLCLAVNLLTACTSTQTKPVDTTLLDIEKPPEKEVVACEPPPAETVIKYIEKKCPVQKVKPPVKRIEDKLIVGRVENVGVEGKNLILKARIDTGATTSSLNAIDLTYFERDGKKWVRFATLNAATQEKVYFERKIKRHVRIKELSTKNQRRPVVLMTLIMGDVEETVEVSLTDRSKYLYQVLIGRNFLLDRMIVDVSQKFTAKLK